jgi:hypothetical protein
VGASEDPRNERDGGPGGHDRIPKGSLPRSLGTFGLRFRRLPALSESLDVYTMAHDEGGKLGMQQDQNQAATKQKKDAAKIRYSELLYADRKIKKLLDTMQSSTRMEEFGANYPAGNGSTEDTHTLTPVNQCGNRKRKRRQQENDDKIASTATDSPKKSLGEPTQRFFIEKDKL